MAITIALENPIRLVKVTKDNLKSFENTLSTNRLHLNQLIKQPMQKFIANDVVKFVVVGDPSDDFILRYTNKGTQVTKTTNTIGGLKYIIFDVDLSNISTDTFRLYGEYNTDSYVSDLMQIVPNDINLLKVEYFENENTLFVPYESNSIVFHRYINAKFLSNISFEGESTVYDNIGKEEKTHQIAKRVFNLQVPRISIGEIESLRAAMGRTNFYINEVEYVSNGNPEVEQIGKTNTYNLQAELTQANIEGFNKSN